MRAAILRSGMLLALASAATAQTELFFATGVDSTGWAQAQSNADGHVLIESPQYPRGLWMHLVDEAGDALTGLQVEYQGRPDSLVAIRCVDPGGGVRETLVWTRPEGDPLRLTLKPKETADLPAGVTSIDWRIDPTAVSLLEPEEETRLIGWEAVVAFLRKRGQSQDGRTAVQFDVSTNLVVDLGDPEAIETLVTLLQQAHRPVGTPPEESAALDVQVFRGGRTLLEGVIFYTSLFKDLNLEKAVREALGRPYGRLTLEEVTSLTKLRTNSRDIDSLAGLEQLIALQRLELSNNSITDLTPLADLKNLQYLYLSDNQIPVDITPLAQLTDLSVLWLNGNQITDLTPLNQLTDLSVLWLNRNQITDLTPLNQLTKLNMLYLISNQITDLTPLNQLTNLYKLHLSSNQIADLTPLNQLTKLNVLYLVNTEIIDITPLAQLTKLNDISLAHNRITDLTSLAQLTNLKNLHLSSNQIADLTPLAHLKNLRWLDLTSNQVADLTPLVLLNNLDKLWLDSNQIADLTPLAHLKNLRWLELASNQIEDLSPLLVITGLDEDASINLENNPLSTLALTEHIPVLEARGVYVHY